MYKGTINYSSVLAEIQKACYECNPHQNLVVEVKCWLVQNVSINQSGFLLFSSPQAFSIAPHQNLKNHNPTTVTISIPHARFTTGAARTRKGGFTPLMVQSPANSWEYHSRKKFRTAQLHQLTMEYKPIRWNISDFFLMKKKHKAPHTNKVLVFDYLPLQMHHCLLLASIPQSSYLLSEGNTATQNNLNTDNLKITI